LVGIEERAMVHQRVRAIMALARQFRPTPATDAKKHVKWQNNDAADAAAVCVLVSGNDVLALSKPANVQSLHFRRHQFRWSRRREWRAGKVDDQETLVLLCLHRKTKTTEVDTGCLEENGSREPEWPPLFE
jgi:hypothetical protein